MKLSKWVDYLIAMGFSVIDHKGLVHQVQFMVCTHVNMQKKLLIPKVDSLLKHIGHSKCNVLMLNVDARFYYYNKDSTRVKNERA
jgi:hypothetical protein